MTPAQERELALLMAASQHGDRVSYEALLQALGHVVTLYVRRRVGAAHWVDDVVGDGGGRASRVCGAETIPFGNGLWRLTT